MNSTQVIMKQKPALPIVAISAQFDHLWQKTVPLAEGDINSIADWLKWDQLVSFKLIQKIEAPVTIHDVTFQNLTEMHPSRVFVNGTVYSYEHAEKHFSDTHHPSIFTKMKARLNDVNNPDRPVAFVKDRTGNLHEFFENGMTVSKNEEGKWELRNYRREFGRNAATSLQKKPAHLLERLLPGLFR